jgi:hypothetical protein
MRACLSRLCVGFLCTGGFALALSPCVLASGDANEASCGRFVGTEASPGYRSYLADCRAYEMVTPAFKAGLQVQSIPAVAENGSRVIGESLGVFGEAGADPLAAYYELNRGSTGWLISAISPPASQFPTSTGMMAASSDLRTTLWGLRRSPQSVYAEGLYLREASGAFVMVGSMVPPAAEAGPPAGSFQNFLGIYRFAGASADLSHVLFTVSGTFGSEFWPGDTTAEKNGGSGNEGTSLYQYVGSGATKPALIGVDSSGRLISSCSTYLGSDESRDTYNAVSESGEQIYFTARGHSDPACENPAAPEVSELYARLNGIDTVPISEPTPAACTLCNTTLRSPAAFQGASRDGSKAFFVTEAPLLAGATTMNLYELDFDDAAGEKLVRVSTGSPAPEVQGVLRVSQDGSHVYFVAKGVLTESPNGQGQEPVPGGDNLYDFERDARHPLGQVTYVATLVAADSQDWAASDRRPAQATPDGRYLVFQSAADLTAGDDSTQPQVFEYNSASGELVRISIGQIGYTQGAVNADADGSTVASQQYVGTLSPTESNTNLAVSFDGSVVVFTSHAALTAQAETAASGGGQSVYEYRSTTSLADGNVYLVSDGRDTVNHEGGIGAVAVGLDGSGDDIYFKTADSLLEQDVDSQVDIYDARSGGGFPPLPVPATCDREGCQGPPAAMPEFGALASSSTLPEGGALSPAAVPTSSKRPAAALTRKEKLARALKACRRRRGRRRAVCEVDARRAYRGTPVSHSQKTRRHA